jgi:hypothetical protein
MDKYLIGRLDMIKLLVLPALFAYGVAFANPGNDMMLNLSSSKQKTELQKTIASGGIACSSVTKTMYQGQDKKGNAFWSAACSNGKSYVVMIYNDAEGSTKALDCGVLKALAGTSCFTKF